MFLVKFLMICCVIAINMANARICSKDDTESYQNEPCFDLGDFKFNMNKRVEERKDVELECYVRNKAAYSVIWMFENQLISLDGTVIRPDPNIKLDTDLITKFNLRLAHVSEKNKGSYKCQISTMTAQNLEYDLDVLVAPTVQRSPSQEVITLNQGETLRVQCLATGNPEPKLTWSKRGDKAEHTTIDETKSELIMEDVDQTHADTYSCTANNDIGNPVTSEFKVLVKFTPIITIPEEDHVKKGILYTKDGQKEKIKCSVDAYPIPMMTLFHNDMPVSSDKLFKEAQSSGKKIIMTYKFESSSEAYGEYKCVAENEVGTSSATIKVTPNTGEVSLKKDNFPIYSDAIVFEWSTLSGSKINEINVEYKADGKNATFKKSKTHKKMHDDTVLPPTYIHENSQFKDFYELTHLTPNTTYTIRLQLQNDAEEWSSWSNELTIKTHAHHAERKHKPHSFHHKYHAKKQHNLFDGDNSNLKYNSYLGGDSQMTRASITLILINLFIFKALIA